MRIKKGQQSIRLKCYTLEKVIVNDDTNGHLLQRIGSGVFSCNGSCGKWPRHYKYDSQKIRFCCHFKQSKNVSIYYTNMEGK